MICPVHNQVFIYNCQINRVGFFMRIADANETIRILLSEYLCQAIQEHKMIDGCFCFRCYGCRYIIGLVLFTCTQLEPRFQDAKSPENACDNRKYDYPGRVKAQYIVEVIIQSLGRCGPFEGKPLLSTGFVGRPPKHEARNQHEEGE